MKGLCKVCGCTDLNPCTAFDNWFCYWTNAEEDLCSFCLEEENKHIETNKTK